MLNGETKWLRFRLISAWGVGLSLLACSARVGDGVVPMGDEGAAGGSDVGAGATGSGGATSTTGTAGASMGGSSATAPGTGGLCNFSSGVVVGIPRPLLSSAEV